MPTPNLIEDESVTGFLALSYYDFGPNQDLGPFEFGSNRYLGYLRVDPATFDQFTAIASTPDGIAFTCHDHANAPLVNFTSFLTAAGAVCRNGDILYTCYYDLSGNLSIIPFDMSTNLYGAILSGGPAVTNHVLISSLRVLSTGTLLVLYGTDQGATTDLKAVTCTTGGSWGTPTVVATSGGDQTFGMSMVIDSADRAHILYTRKPIGTRTIHYCMLDGVTVSGDTLIGDGGFPYLNQGTGRYDSANDRVLIPFQKNAVSGDGGGLLIVNNASTAPSVTEDIVLPFDPNLSFFGVAISLDGSTYIFTYEDYNTTEQLVMWERPAGTSGIWTGPTNFWDYDIDPPPPDPANPGVPSIELNPPSGLVPLSGGNYGTLISFFGGGGVPTDVFCNTLYYMESVAVTATLQLIKQVSGGAAVATDWTLYADGPTPISGAGGVGPSTVAIGSYDLSETPVTDYSLSSLVCVGGTQIGSVITLADGESAVCTFTNLFTGVTPAPPPPPACIPFEPTTPSPSLVIYDEPTELKGS